MTRRLTGQSELLLALAAACGVAILYLWRLTTVPVFVGGDEAYFGMNAHLIASTGRDLAGRFLPLYFEIDGRTWYQPLLVYLIAPVVKLLGVSAWSIRTPTAVIGIVDVLLTYAIGRKLFGNARYAALGALMVAFSPAHLLLSRMAVDYVCPLPFVLGWLWCLLTALETGDPTFAFCGGLLLGICCYSYIAAWMMMPVYLLITFATLYRSRAPMRLLIATAVGVALPLVPAIIWMRMHPEALAATLVRYRLSGTADASILETLRSMTRYYALQGRLSLYWNYFDPVYLFLTGSPDPTLSTGRAGVFLAAASVLLAAGIYEIIRRSDRSFVLLAGFVTAPLAPVLIVTGNAIQRELVTVPFGALIAAVGARRLLEDPDRRVRTFATVLLLSLPLQFAYFATDYFSAYPARSADRLDPLNMREVTRYLIHSDASRPIPRVYLGEALDDVVVRWRFHLAQFNREDLWQRTWIVDAGAHNQWSVRAPLPTAPLDALGIPSGSVLLFYANDPAIARLAHDRECCDVDRTITGPAGEALSVLIRRR